MISKYVKKMSIGTAQFGLAYGITNQIGAMQIEECAAIISTARDAGINKIDTAPGYGDAEKKLGEIGLNGFLVNSKLPKLEHEETEKDILNIIEKSLKNLNISQLDSLILHYPWDLRSEKKKDLILAIKTAKNLGYFRSLGASIYLTSEAVEFNEILDFDLIQAPVNVLDTRFLQKGVFEHLKSSRISLQARSIFLQGLLLDRSRSGYKNISVHLTKELENWFAWLDDNTYDAKSVILSSLLNDERIESIVFGVTSHIELKEILSFTDQQFSLPRIDVDYPLLDPRNWS